MASKPELSIADRKDIVKNMESDAWNHGKLDVVDEGCSPDYVAHDSMGDRDLEESKEMIERVRAGTSDFEFRIDDLFGEDDRVTLRYTMSGTNTGPSFLTEEPTGKSWEGTGISIYRFENGQVVEQWDTFDYLGVMQQLGLLPSSEE
ncbi:MAG TPA: ester cyclase [Natrialbaceae archaeon]|nr:ester cyclase [Natrialbaceae archaeon]